MKTGIDWTAVRTNLNAEEWQEQENECGEERAVFLGTCFSLFPSGKYYASVCDENVDPIEIALDQKYMESLESEASQHDLWIASSEGDPCDILVGESRDTLEQEPNRCDQCEAVMIQGVYCHEFGCPNK